MIKKLNKRNIWLTLCLILAITLGIFLSFLEIRTATHQVQKNLLEQARLLGSGIDDSTYSFFDNYEDRDPHIYLRLKENLQDVSYFFPEYQSLYLVGRDRDGALFYYIEPVLAEKEKDLNNILASNKKAIEEVFENSNAQTKGPYRTPGKASLTIFLPLKEEQTQHVSAVFGMEIELSTWQSLLNKKIASTIVFTAALILIILGTWYFLNQRDQIGQKKKINIFFRNVEVFAIILIGITVTVFASFLADRIENNSRKETFLSLALVEKLNFLQALSDQSKNNLESLARFFEGSQHVEQDEFLLFTDYMAKNKGIQAWVWVPEISAKDLRSNEKYLDFEGLEDFQIWDNSENKSNELKIRETHNPIIYINPQENNNFLIGFDLASEMETFRAMVDARQSGMITASDPLDLEYDQEVLSTILVFRPVFYDQDSSKTQQGFVGIFLVMENLLSHLYPNENNTSNQLNLSLYQLDREGDPKLIASTSGEDTTELKRFQQWNYYNDVLGIAIPIFAYGKTYTLLIGPGQAFYLLDTIREDYLIVLLGILLTASIAVIAGIVNNRKYFLEQQIKLATHELAASDHRYHSLYSNMSEGVALHELLYDSLGNPADYMILDVNLQYEKITGLKKEKAIGQKASKLYSKKQSPFLDVYAKVVETRTPTHFEIYYANFKKYLNISVYSTGQDKFATVFSDITARKKAEKRMEYLSFHDSLTGLYNKAYFDEELKRLNTKRQLPLSIIMADVNGLKFTNDAFGHKEGDALLIKFAEIFNRVFRKEDIIARWGGDEFIILLPKTTPSTTKEIVLRIEAECAKTSHHKIPISISMGFSAKTKKEQDINKIIIESEKYMYQKKLTDSKSVSSAIISSLKKILNEISNETLAHADRMRKLALKLGNAFNLPENEIVSLSLLSTLHDIGKIAIPRKVLIKPKKLTESEWALIKKHPEIGYNIAQSSPHLSHISKAILHHHERWDGNGYPHGLQGNEIPVTARILSLVDAYDVMISGRPYKPKMSKMKALEEIKNCSGTQFDPEIVQKFIEIIDL